MRRFRPEEKMSTECYRCGYMSEFADCPKCKFRKGNKFKTHNTMCKCRKCKQKKADRRANRGRR